MECLVKLQKRPKFIDAIEKFQLSGAYPVFFAVLCAISGLGNKHVYLPIISVLALSILFSVFFVRDNKVFITPILMIYYSLGTDVSRAYGQSDGNVVASFDPDGLVGICILAAVIAIPVFTRFILDGSVTDTIKNRGLTFYGIVGLNAAILLGGIFSGHWSPINLVYALILIAGLDIFYLVLTSIIKRSDSSIIPYVCYVLVFTCLMIAFQIFTRAYRLYLDGTLFWFDRRIGKWILMRERLSLSWGVTTIIGASSTAGIPAAMYLAKNKRFPLFYYISAIIMWSVTLVVNARASMLVGGAFLIAGIVIISFCGKNKKCNLIFSLVLFASFVTALILAYNKITETISIKDALAELSRFMRLGIVDDRIVLYEAGLRDFLSAPIFGVGWEKGALSPELQKSNFYGNMYHCIVIQMGASAGIVGIAALIFHIKDYFRIALKRACADRFLLLSVPASILLMSLVDNYIFYLNLQIFYVAFLAVAEKHLEETKNKTD